MNQFLDLISWDFVIFYTAFYLTFLIRQHRVLINGEVLSHYFQINSLLLWYCMQSQSISNQFLSVGDAFIDLWWDQ